MRRFQEEMWALGTENLLLCVEAKESILRNLNLSFSATVEVYSTTEDLEKDNTPKWPIR